MLRSSALRRFSTITSCISSGMAVKRDTLIPESTELILLLLENTASAISDSLRVLFPSGLPVTDLDLLGTLDIGAFEEDISALSSGAVSF